MNKIVIIDQVSDCPFHQDTECQHLGRLSNDCLPEFGQAFPEDCPLEDTTEDAT